MPMRTKTFAVLPAMYRLVGHGVAEVSLWEKFLPLLRGILQRLTIYRCRFCGELYRHWRHPPRKGVCPDLPSGHAGLADGTWLRGDVAASRPQVKQFDSSRA